MDGSDSDHVKSIMDERPTPFLSRHAHLRPDDGTCVMEWVSHLANEPFTDSPRSTHPLLAEIARTVNDVLDDEPRQALAGRARRLLGTASRDPAVSHAIMDSSVRVALAAGITSSRVKRAASRAWSSPPADASDPAWQDVMVDVFYQRGPARHLLHHIAARIGTLPPDRRDRALLALLDNAIEAVTPRFKKDTPRSKVELQPQPPRQREEATEAFASR